MSICWIGIGANSGDAHATFDAAWVELERNSKIRLLNRSGIYSTAPVGEHAGGIFLNAVFSLCTDLPPIAVLNLLQAIEDAQGRTHNVRWGPRTLDLDLLFVDQLVLNEPRLTLPHPAAWFRRFVLDPLREVQASFLHPVLQETFEQLHRRLTRRPLVVACHEASFKSLTTNHESRFPGVSLASCADASNSAVCLRLSEQEPAGPFWDAVPVADLTSFPGSNDQRVIDFLTAILDEPHRARDW